MPMTSLYVEIRRLPRIASLEDDLRLGVALPQVTARSPRGFHIRRDTTPYAVGGLKNSKRGQLEKTTTLARNGIENPFPKPEDTSGINTQRVCCRHRD
jgi:hypothetical protein